MTLLPSDDFNVRGVEGQRYDVNEICAVPDCNLRSVHGHHIWPRSFLRSQPQDWVEIPDFGVVANKIGLCVDHHNMVSGNVGGHRARIQFGSGVFWWEVRVWDNGNGEVSWWQRHNVPLVYQPLGARDRGTPVAPAQDDRCPSCGKPKHAKPRKSLSARKTKEWTLTVPDDAEIGSDVLDGWSDDLAILLGFGEQSSRLKRYHAVTTGLAWVIQNRERFVADIVEAERS